MPDSIKVARDLDALEPLFAFLAECFAAHEIDDDTAFCLKLAAEELFTNLVRHNRGSDRQIEFGFASDRERIEMRLVDSDVEPSDPSRFPRYDPEASLAERDASGLGLHLVRSVVDRLAYEYGDRTMTVIATKNR